MIIDANILIAYLGGEEKVVRALTNWRKEGKILFLPTVVESEILSFSDWRNQELRNTERFLGENFVSIPLDRTLARAAAEVYRQYQIKFPDTVIVAAALALNLPVVSRDRQFRKIREIMVAEI